MSIRRWILVLLVGGLVSAVPAVAQQAPGSSSSQVPGLNPTENPSTPPTERIRVPQPAEPAGTNEEPALMDPAGPTVSLQTSEAMFDVAVALNACGYDDGLDESNPVRKRVRDAVNQATAASAAARQDRDRLCLFIDRHRLDDVSRNLAQYVSLALYLTPPPQLTPSVDEQELPPDATGVVEILPILREFAADIDLHVIWVENRATYDEITSELHGPLTQMIVSTNYYLKMPATTGGGRRFLVVVEPLLSPEETNARVYGTDYVVVASPKNGQIYMRLVRHAYLHYEIEPLLYLHEESMERMMPILKTVQDAPLDFVFKNDMVALTIESLIRAIEARTMDTGIREVTVPAGLTQSQADPYEHARSVSLEKIAVLKEAAVEHSMAQGFVLTQYFYNQLKGFEQNAESLSQAIGPMVYGMDIASVTHEAKETTFDAHDEGELMGRAPMPPQGLDLAELKLVQGDVAGAAALAERVLASRSGDTGRADFIMARVDLMNGKIDDAQAAFQNTLTASKDARTLAWSHIYLGRIFDVEEERDQAVAEYKAALTARDGQPDTKRAAEQGLKQPFSLPQAHDDQGTPAATPQAAAPQTPPRQ